MSKRQVKAARINFEPEVFSDVRFHALVESYGGDHGKAIGELIRFWQLAQRFWVQDELVPMGLVKIGKFGVMLETGWAREEAPGLVYACGSEEQFAWIRAKHDNGKKGGRPTLASVKETETKPTETYSEPTVTVGNPTDSVSGSDSGIIASLNSGDQPASLPTSDLENFSRTNPSESGLSPISIAREANSDPPPEEKKAADPPPECLFADEMLREFLRDIPLRSQQLWLSVHAKGDKAWLEENLRKLAAWRADNPHRPIPYPHTPLSWLGAKLRANAEKRGSAQQGLPPPSPEKLARTAQDDFAAAQAAALSRALEQEREQEKAELEALEKLPPEELAKMARRARLKVLEAASGMSLSCAARGTA